MSRPDPFIEGELNGLPQVRQLVQVGGGLAGVYALRLSLTPLLDNAMVGVIYVDRRGCIVEANACARAILQRGDALSDRAGLLRARLAYDDLRLRKLLARVLSDAGSASAGGSITVERSSGTPRLAVHITSDLIRGKVFAAGRIAALALIVDPASKPRIDAERVAAILDLTQAESRVAAALAEGASVREIATDTGRKESSVRWLIKNIHVKLDISRNAELVRMVLSVAWGTGPWPSAPGDQPRDHDGREGAGRSDACSR